MSYDCAGCNLLEVSPVTLATGKVVCSSCIEWRLECEARHVAKKSREDRLDLYAEVAKKRGKPAAENLVERVKQLAAQAKTNGQRRRGGQ